MLGKERRGIYTHGDLQDATFLKIFLFFIFDFNFLLTFDKKQTQTK